ncbi:NmrA family NAD(P)-binding protein [Paenibacillus sp. YIM B09110]|uniref:NmrA family NAD(P)-binding protein n=1 Tax=Paenibacillus sp. YIM B09110 TaxID=3126102 RepID=UPI00301E2F44
MKIAITGANGQLGIIIMEQLLTRLPAEQMIACVREPGTMKRYGQLGVTVKRCDYDQPDTLPQAFEGATHVLLISSSHRDDLVRIRQHSHVIEAAKRADISHLMYTSFAYPEASSASIAHMHRATEQTILAAGMTYTFFRNAFYVDFVNVLDLNTAITSRELVIAPGNWHFNAVSRFDLGRAIASVLSEPELHSNRIYELTVPTAWQFNDLANALSELTGTSITVREDAAAQHWIYGLLRKLDTSSTSDAMERLIGSPVTSLLETIRPFIHPNQ